LWGDHSGGQSPTWPVDHDREISESWPAGLHRRDLSPAWPPGHRIVASLQPRSGWPGGHGFAASYTWPPDHATALSNRWGANHAGSFSAVEVPSAQDEVGQYIAPPGVPLGLEAPSGLAEYPGTHSLLLALEEAPDLEDVAGMFRRVLAAMEPEVTIQPSENYLYFRFPWARGSIWGNLRLSPPERDEGWVHFAYFEFNEAPRGPDDFYSQYRRFGPEDGVEIERREDGSYRLRYRGVERVFHLAEMDQSEPPAGVLAAGERWVQNTRDESGLDFRLVFDEETESFFWVLDERQEVRESWREIADGVAVGERTGFVFLEVERARRVLIGVAAQNIRQNNYYDGPFDQLADNYLTEESMLSEFIQRAYPYTRGEIDWYGKFLRMAGSRVAITPYHAYESEAELMEGVDWCRENRGEEFLGCVTYDSKRRYR